METSKAAYKRIVLKLSGEALRESGARETISPQIVKEIARQVKEVYDLGVPERRDVWRSYIRHTQGAKLRSRSVSAQSRRWWKPRATIETLTASIAIANIGNNNLHNCPRR